jgi:hypothetical protein
VISCNVVGGERSQLGSTRSPEAGTAASVGQRANRRGWHFGDACNMQEAKLANLGVGSSTDALPVSSGSSDALLLAAGCAADSNLDSVAASASSQLPAAPRTEVERATAAPVAQATEDVQPAPPLPAVAMPELNQRAPVEPATFPRSRAEQDAYTPLYMNRAPDPPTHPVMVCSLMWMVWSRCRRSLHSPPPPPSLTPLWCWFEWFWAACQTSKINANKSMTNYKHVNNRHI